LLAIPLQQFFSNSFPLSNLFSFKASHTKKPSPSESQKQKPQSKGKKPQNKTLNQKASKEKPGILLQ
jgi:hypothetical protein